MKLIKLLGVLLLLGVRANSEEVRAFYIEHMELMSRSYCSGVLDANYPQRSDGTYAEEGYGDLINSINGASPGNAFDGLLERLRLAGYNAIVSNLPLSAYRTGPERRFYTSAIDRFGVSIDVFKEASEKADTYGLKLIPMVSVNTKNWNRDWKLLFSDTTVNAGGGLLASPVSANPQFDAEFIRILKKIKAEYSAAALKNISKDPVLDLWLNFDEYWFMNSNGVAQAFMGSSSLSDRRALQSKYNSVKSWSKAFRQVYARSFLDRLRLVRGVLGNSVTVTVWANSFITQANDGTYAYDTWMPNVKVCYTGEYVASSGSCPNAGETIADLPGLTLAEKSEVQAGYVMAPWFYFDMQNATKKSDIQGAMAALNNKKFRILPFCAFDFNGSEGKSQTSSGSAMNALREILIYPRIVNSRNEGFVSAVYPGAESQKAVGNWTNYWWSPSAKMYEQIPEYQVIEMAPREYRGKLMGGVSRN